jgi:hypothetical protein
VNVVDWRKFIGEEAEMPLSIVKAATCVSSSGVEPGLPASPTADCVRARELVALSSMASGTACWLKLIVLDADTSVPDTEAT